MHAASIIADVGHEGSAGMQRVRTCEEQRGMPENGPGLILARSAVAKQLQRPIAMGSTELIDQTLMLQ
jgi:hypothetical protein